jgi:DNA-binding XRE family transcriptional regulator
VPGNNVQKFRESLMMSKAELARKAGLSTLTIDRIEAGRPCRLDTKRKILLALGLKVSDKDRVFGPASEVATQPAGSGAAAAADPFRRP